MRSCVHNIGLTALCLCNGRTYADNDSCFLPLIHQRQMRHRAVDRAVADIGLSKNPVNVDFVGLHALVKGINGVLDAVS